MSSVKISRILHAGYTFECGTTTIAFDPIFENPFSRNCFAFPPVNFDLEKIRALHLDAVFISHYHDDHCSLESLVLLDRSTPIYIFCIFEELLDWIRQLGFTSVFALKLNQPIRLGAFEITPRRALDADVDSIFHIHAGDLNILNVVDSWIDEETLSLLAQTTPWDLVLWPFQTMRELEVLAPLRSEPAAKSLPPEWIEQLKTLKPRALVPSSCQFLQESWSWYNQALFPISYALFKKEIAQTLKDCKVVRLDPSISIELSKGDLQSSTPLSWVSLVSSQSLDYEYRPELQPPSTAEVAKHFPALTSQQMERVRNYCQSEIFEKYGSLSVPDESYFEKPRSWRLSVYDHEGIETAFDYRVTAKKIESANSHFQDLEWWTEIAAYKLYSALETGESLTSMYIRINDKIFDPSTEAELQDVDVIEDPLIRCLFNNSFGAYQWAQLVKLKASLFGT